MGIDYMDAERQIREALGWFEEASNGSYTYVDKECFDTDEHLKYTPIVTKLRKEIREAAQRCFDKGIAPEEFMLKINW